MYSKYSNFIKGISVNLTGRVGVVLTTSAFILFLFFEILRMAGVLTNAYVGLITYLLFPLMFVVGLILIPISWMSYKKNRGMTTSELLNERFDADDVKARGQGSKIFLTIIVFTGINIIFMTGASFRTLKFMDESRFCGTACHSVMGPEWATYQVSPHSRVNCVECHVGEGVDALISSKMSGLRQMVKATLNTYERPVPTPVHTLRPSKETCEKCHWPEKFYGSRLKVITRYESDERTTPKFVTLNMKIDSGKEAGKAGIHWHINSENEVRYASVEDQREDMLWVDVRQEDGTFKRYTNKKFVNRQDKDQWNHARTMDCVDCHNRATHIYEDPKHAIDDRISKGLVDRELPFVKREILAAIKTNYNDKDAALTGIQNHLYGFYRTNYDSMAGSWMEKIDQAVEAAQEIYSRNIHPGMKVEWGTYPNHIGHQRNGGCFRCHNENLVDDQGSAISFDCTLCHSILANGEDEAFKYLEEPSDKDPNFQMHHFLKDEFLKSARK